MEASQKPLETVRQKLSSFFTVCKKATGKEGSGRLSQAMLGKGKAGILVAKSCYRPLSP